jgi:hypothetical protein
MGQVIALSFLAALNPTLLTASTIMLLLPAPRRLMLGYLMGAYITSITLGLIIVFEAADSSAVSTSKDTLSPSLDLLLAGVAFLLAFLIGTGRLQRFAERHRERKRRKMDGKAKKDEDSRVTRLLRRGSPRVAFLLGILLTLPGASYLASLISLSKLEYPTVPTVLTVVLINVIMLALLEIPLLAYTLSPDTAAERVDRAKAWVIRRGQRIAVTGFCAAGALLVIKGVLGLVT